MRWGNPDATDAQIERACQLAQADEFIRQLPGGYDYVISRGGTNVSGGQKQRIAIARVFLKNPPILILDEATSALDNESEILVGQSLEKLAHGRTTLTIAHRLTTIKDYDRILVLGEEGIVESGTHDQLLAKQASTTACGTSCRGKIRCNWKMNTEHITLSNSCSSVLKRQH